ncbi:hypothetical protein ACOKFD_14940 [Flagellimonas sp. S174]|uniref:hypothetical protein n=1 Tax=Flagellimonas sp. S174 TaxID=3410790 RepID=UPI003BF51DA2
MRLSTSNSYIKSILAVFIIIQIGCSQKRNDEWQLIFETDKNGQISYGSKDNLIELVRKGYPVRIGWESMGKTSVEHTIDVRFLTVANETEVFAMLEPFWAQRPNLKSDTLSIIPIANETHWILSTNGLRSSMMANKVNDTVINYEPQLFGYPIKWFVKK